MVSNTLPIYFRKGLTCWGSHSTGHLLVGALFQVYLCSGNQKCFTPALPPGVCGAAPSQWFLSVQCARQLSSDPIPVAIQTLAAHPIPLTPPSLPLISMDLRTLGTSQDITFCDWLTSQRVVLPVNPWGSKWQTSSLLRLRWLCCVDGPLDVYPLALIACCRVHHYLICRYIHECASNLTDTCFYLFTLNCFV